MKKNIKKIVYDILKTDSEILTLITSADQIFYQNDDESENRAKATFDTGKSIITYYRISEKPGDYPKRSSLFQITSWSKDNLTAESLKNAIVEVFHRKKNEDGLSYVNLVEVGSEIYDKDLNIYGIPLTFVFIYKDVEF